MGRPYSQDLRERVMAAVDGGMRVYAAAPGFRVSGSYIYKALGRRTKTGETKERTRRAGRKAKLAPRDEALRTQTGEHPDATLAELKTWLASARQIEVSTGCLWNRLRRLHLPLKKRTTSRTRRSRVYAKLSPRRGPTSAISRLTAQISILSSSSLPSSRRCSGRRPRELSMTCSRRSPMLSPSSPHRNAPTMSQTAAIATQPENALAVPFQ